MSQKILVKYLYLTQNLGSNYLKIILVLRFS